VPKAKVVHLASSVAVTKSKELNTPVISGSCPTEFAGHKRLHRLTKEQT
jgi:hypothetical protein